MPIGKGKYHDALMKIIPEILGDDAAGPGASDRGRDGDRVALLLVINGTQGHGTSTVASMAGMATLPDTLRVLADDIEASYAQTLGEVIASSFGLPSSALDQSNKA